MFKSLFDDNGMYMLEAQELDHRICKAIAPFYNEGYSPREVLCLLTSAAVSEHCGKMIDLAMQRRNEKMNSTSCAK